jgi:hypothetical protein
MTWVKVDDHANEHEKQVEAGPEACWLWACGLMYCNRQKKKTGFIPSAQVRGLYVRFSDAQVTKLARELVRVHLWEVADGGFSVHDYGDYQPMGERTWEDQVRGEQRKRILARDGLKCGICGGEVAEDDVHIDHILPISKGGKTEDSNLRVTHSGCNSTRLRKARSDAGKLGGIKSGESRRAKSNQTIEPSFGLIANQNLVRSESDSGSRIEPHARAHVGTGSGSDLSDPSRDPDPDSQRATPEQEAAEASNEVEKQKESSFDLGKRLWGEEFQRAKERPYPFGGPMDRHQDETLRWFGGQCQARGGADAERWGRHWLIEYFGLTGYWEREKHALLLLRRALPDLSDPKKPSTAAPGAPVDDVPDFKAVATHAEVVERATRLMASLPKVGRPRPPVKRVEGAAK